MVITKNTFQRDTGIAHRLDDITCLTDVDVSPPAEMETE